ncbi:hypothetical protein [Proteiniphilum sp. UBA5463]|jgi:hypothetical protein|uniref:hypothetical protein n=1 Tax=Proteiniphilum sp. UBA5463 TaxID=1947281 RepID=UPI00257E21F6|nr:hypothetical protein [Proteiniphilum sp. UBA5463]
MPVINTTSKNLKKYQQKTIQKVKDLVVDKITDVEEMATRQAPNFISIDKKFTADELEGEVGVMGENVMAAYIEFGTGLYAADLLKDYPQWIRDIAIEFYINGMGTLKSSPYLYNNFLVKEAEFKNELNKILDGSVDDN